MIRKITGMQMEITPSARIAENATLVGDVHIADSASVWYGAVLRGDSGAIRIGSRSAIEDNVTIHSAVTMGEDVVIGHNAVIHGCTIENRCLIGMNATVMSGAVIGSGSLIAAGCLVTQRTVIPPNSLVMGVPGKVIGPLSESQQAQVDNASEEYIRKANMQLPRWDEATPFE